jgi:hypothetical protein
MNLSYLFILRLLPLILLAGSLLASCEESGFEPDDTPTISGYITTPLAVAWEKTYDGESGEYGYDIAGAPDGSIFVAGNGPGDDGSTDCHVMKLDGNGDLLWQRRFGGPDDETARAVIALPDGGCLAAGWRATRGYHDYVYIARLDSEGALLWDSSYVNREVERFVLEAAASPDGTYLLTGYQLGNGRHWEAIVIKIDAEGRWLWETVLTGDHQERGFEVAAAADGTIAVVAESMQGNFTSALWLVDAGGTVLHRMVDTLVAPHMLTVVAGADNDFITGSLIEDGGPMYTMRVRRVDRLGNIIWEMKDPYFSFNDPIAMIPGASAGTMSVVTDWLPILEVATIDGSLRHRYVSGSWTTKGIQGADRTADGGVVILRSTGSGGIGTSSDVVVQKIAAPRDGD